MRKLTIPRRFGQNEKVVCEDRVESFASFVLWSRGRGRYEVDQRASNAVTRRTQRLTFINAPSFTSTRGPRNRVGAVKSRRPSPTHWKADRHR